MCISNGHGQKALFMPSATQPSPQTFIAKSQIRWYQGAPSIEQLMIPFSIAMGIAPRNSLEINSAGNFSRDSTGLSDINVAWKWRFRNVDTTALNTSRTALITSLQVPSGNEGWSTKSFNPSLGLAHTSIIDRLGLGASIEYKINTGSGARNNPTGMDGKENALNTSASIIWRLSPKKYTASTKGSWYLSAEGSWVVTESGSSIRMGPSLFYEATTWVWEIGWQAYPLNNGNMSKYQGMMASGVRIFF